MSAVALLEGLLCLHVGIQSAPYHTLLPCLQRPAVESRSPAGCVLQPLCSKL